MTEAERMNPWSLHDRGHDVRNLSPTTRAVYVHNVKKFSQYGRSPDCLGLEDIRTYRSTWCHRELLGRRSIKLSPRAFSSPSGPAPVGLTLPSAFSLVSRVLAGCNQSPLPTAASRR